MAGPDPGAGAHHPAPARRNPPVECRALLSIPKSAAPERLLWSRDIRFATGSDRRPMARRILELESGMVVIGPASEMTDALAAAIAEEVHSPPYGLVDLDMTARRGRAPPRRDGRGGPAVGPRRPDRHVAVEPGRPDEDARLLLQPSERPPGRVPADRRAGDGPALTSTSACSGRACRCCRSRSARSSTRRSTPTARSSSTGSSSA